ncbi:AraC family transcriptional regulator [Foetidibacter luteolus]|uniref:AraC family transcriptional regulator n=1 Tax=Foetidibacter luteolus TaxID=2608880 RepID=UPI00129AE9D0|nr:AraC family transcriptional regulator [Foetidibacter luteolus]
MKPVLEHLPLQREESFVVKHFSYSYYPTPWHFHPEYELVLVTESTGKRFIGDNISDFKQGNLAFLGPNLPHLYRNDTPYYQPKSKLKARSIVVHFRESSFGENFLLLPETRKLKTLFDKSARGLEITGALNKSISIKMHELCELQGFSRWLKLLDILHEMAGSKQCNYISNTTVTGLNETETERLSKIFEFVMQHFKREILVAEAAAMVNLAENSFSRYFSQRTRKTFTGFVNEVRLNHACKLLIENDMSVSEICFECGFNNLSNFNRQFLALYGISPLAYRKQYWNKL